MNNRRATIPPNRRSLFRATPIHPLIEDKDVPNVTYVTVTPREPSPPPPPLPPKQRPPPKQRLSRESLIESPSQPQPQSVYINSSNGYIDKEVSKLRIRVNQLEHELQTIKKLLEKQNKQK